MVSPKRYYEIAAFTALLLIAIVVIVNVVMDPFGMYRLVDLPSVNSRKPAIYQRLRLVKAYEVRRMAPQAIVLGTSRSHIGLRMTHPGWTASPRYNLAFDGATTHEMYAYLVHAQSVHPLTQVVLGLDTWHLSNAPSGARPGFDPNVLFAAPNPLSRVRVAGADLRILASLDTLTASLRTIREQDGGEPEWLAPDGQRLGEAFFHRVGELFHDESPRAYFDAYDRQEIEWRKPAPAAPQSPTPSETDDSSLQWIYRIIEFCRANKIDLRIYITPAHAHQLEMTIAAGEWPRLEQAKRDLVGYLTAEVARHPDRPPFPLWDFSGYSSVTTEPLPPRDGRAEMRYYWDSSHFKQAVGDWILNRVLDEINPSSQPPTDFGVQLTAANLDSALSDIGVARADYARAHLAEITEIQALVLQTLAGAPSPNAEAQHESWTNVVARLVHPKAPSNPK